jgi:hypothetical protein
MISSANERFALCAAARRTMVSANARFGLWRFVGPHMTGLITEANRHTPLERGALGPPERSAAASLFSVSRMAARVVASMAKFSSWNPGAGGAE